MTGKSIWNLSPEEMEKAQRSNKQLEHNPSSIVGSCPEPKEPPVQLHTLSKKCCIFPSRESEKIFNTEIVNNKLSTPPGSLHHFCVSPILHASAHRLPLNMPLHSPISEIQTGSPINPIKIENCEASTSSGLMRDEETNQNYSFDNEINENENIALNKRRKDMPDYIYQKRMSNCDLRDVLRKKQFNRGGSEWMDNGGDNQPQMQTNSDEDFSYNNIQPEKFDLSALKKLDKYHSNQDKWFIVADTNIFLYHIQFLNSLILSDKQCCLVVSKNTQVELENPANNLLRARIDGANDFIANLLDSGYAIKEEENSIQRQIMGNKEDLLNCCKKLIEKKYFVVLISNDEEVLKNKNTTDIPIFTVRGLEEFLCTSAQSVTSQSSESPLLFSNRQIKITIPNEISKSRTIDHRNHKTWNITKKNQIIQNVLTSNNNNNEKQMENATCFLNPTTIRIVDAEVQTDLSLLQLEEMEKVYIMATSNNEQNGEKNKSKHILRRRKLSRSVCNEYVKTNNQNNITSNEMLQKDNNSLPVQPICTKKKVCNNTTSDSSIRQTQYNGETCIGHPIVISNEENNVHLEHNISTTHDVGDIVVKENIEDKNVMFEITSQVMEDFLKINRDEWISRFVQIMEEGLSQVLRRKSSTSLGRKPPPWSMYEAAICIKEEFTEDTDVVDSSSKFLETLSKISDTKGKINSDLSPRKYMEMYSYGVYLIDSLQGIFNNCEDLQAAVESLAKLLKDIQDPQPDPNILESFNDLSQEEFTRDGQTSITEPSISTERSNVILVNEVKSGHESPETRIPTMPTDYNLSLQDDILKDQEQYARKSLPMISFISSECLFSNLTPNKSEGELSDDNTILRYDGDNSDDANCNSPIKNQDQINCSINKTNSSQANNSVSAKENIISGPKIIRNFVKCVELENRLQNKNQSMYHTLHQFDNGDDENNFNFEEDDLNYEEDVDCGHDYQNNTGDNDLHEDHYYSGDMIRFDMNDLTGFKNNHSQSSERLNNENNETLQLDFKYIMKNLAEEINVISNFVYTFCTSTYDKLSRGVLTTNDDKDNIRMKAEKAHLFINKLCTALNSTLQRNEGGSCKLEEVLKNTEFHNVSIDDNDFQKYGKFVARCLVQVNVLKDTVSTVLTALND